MIRGSVFRVVTAIELVDEGFFAGLEPIGLLRLLDCLCFQVSLGLLQS
jgi:hypothetical protein